MKRWTILILTGALLLSCTACGGSKKPPQNTAPLTPPVSQEAEPLPWEDAPAAPDTAPQQSFVEPILSEREDALETPLPPQASAPGAGAEQETPANGPQPDPLEGPPTPVDLDLTPLSSTMIYAELFNMMSAPDDYIGKTIRMKGSFFVYQDPNTQQVYCGVIVQDATACCAQGFDIVMPAQARYPEDYPPAQSEVTVVGTIQADRTREEYGILVLRLEDVSFD